MWNTSYLMRIFIIIPRFKNPDNCVIDMHLRIFHRWGWTEIHSRNYFRLLQTIFSWNNPRKCAYTNTSALSRSFINFALQYWPSANSAGTGRPHALRYRYAISTARPAPIFIGFFQFQIIRFTDKTRLTLSVIPRSTTEDGPMNVMVHCFFNWQAGGAFCIRSLYFLFIRKTIVFGPKM